MARPVFQSHQVFVWLLLGAMATFIQGCGKGKATQLPGPDEGYRFEVPTHSEEDAQKLMAYSRANCADTADCPEAVGLLVVATPRALGMCTAFLVGPTTVMTNNHCIRELIQDRRSCAGLVEIIFPETAGHPAERAGCSQLLYYSDLGRSDLIASPDYARLQLSRPVNREPLGLSRQGVSADESLRVPRMNPVSTGSYLQGELQVVSCDAVQRPWVLPQADHPESPVLVFSGCSMIGAHSGAPMIDSDGRVRAMIQPKLIGAADSEPVSDTLEQPEALAFAANLACLQAPETNPASLPAACRSDLSTTTTQTLRAGLLGKAEERGRAAAEAEGERWSNKSGVFMNWAAFLAQTSAGARKLTLEPVCFHQPDESDNWLRRYRGITGYKKEVLIDLSVPTWDLRVGYNGRQQAIYELEPRGSAAGILSFSPAQLKRENRSRIRIRLEELETSAALLDRSIDLPFCAR